MQRECVRRIRPSLLRGASGVTRGDHHGSLSPFPRHACVPRPDTCFDAVDRPLHRHARAHRRAQDEPQPDKPAATATTLDRITVVGRRQNLVGEAISASEGIVGRSDIADRPMLRTGDLLEFVPGLIATSHSGSGKANQYFLRGFNLDHGTDFSTSVDGMPVNMRTHGHGQGYTDLNFLIPETVDDLTYRKGTYYADVGDFSSAGSAQFHLADSVGRGTGVADPRRRRLPARDAARFDRSRRRRFPVRRRSADLRRPVDRHRRGRAQGQPAVALQLRRRRRPRAHHRDGLQERMEFARPDPAARRRPGD